LRRLAVMLVIGFATLIGAAAEPRVPHLWDNKERLPKPDLSKLTRLRFLTATDFPPFNFLDADGKLSGFHIDFARAICGELGILDRCQIQAVPWNELEPTLQQGGGEAIIAGISVTEANRNRLSFTRPYLVFPARFVTLATKTFSEPVYDRIQGLRVGVIAGSAHEKMLRALFGDVRVVTYARQNWIDDDLKAGKLDAMFGDGMRFGFWLASSAAANCCRFSGGPYISQEFLGAGLAIATKTDAPELTAALNYGIQAVSTKNIFAELYLRYFPVDFF
jgi:polar amino acid transport system substrate-binding protein